MIDRSDRLPHQPGPGAGKAHKRRVVPGLDPALLEAVSPSTVQNVIKKLGELGENGNVAAGKLYLEYAVGKPSPPRKVSDPEPQSANGDCGALESIILNFMGKRCPELKIELATELRTSSRNGVHRAPRDEA